MQLVALGTRLYLFVCTIWTFLIFHFLGLPLAVPGDRLPKSTSTIVEDVPNDEMYEPEEDFTDNDVSKKDDDLSQLDVQNFYY